MHNASQSPSYHTLESSDNMTVFANEVFASAKIECWRCPVYPERHRGNRRTSELFVEVMHNRRNESLIFTFTDVLIHSRLADQLTQRGMNGFRTKPASVRFRDGTVSREYCEFLVTGWGGVANPESGVRLIQECPACLVREFSLIEDIDRLIDWGQWSGDDFFFVYPIPHILITQRAANVLTDLKAKSFKLRKPQTAKEWDPTTPKYLRGHRLSRRMPLDVARKIGVPLGLEWEDDAPYIVKCPE
jgi:hypothetical protein